ncbi:MAG: lysophospholipid acyltransferase family protein [Planctomycetota bacterium]
MRTAGSHLLIFGVRCLGRMLSLLPPRGWQLLSTPGAWILWVVLAKHRRRTLANLEAWGRSGAEARRLGRSSFRSNLLVLFESLAMARLVERRRGVRVDEHITPAALEIIRDLRDGKTHFVQAVSGHIGVWEFVGVEMVTRVRPARVAVSSRLPKNPIVAKYLRDLRSDFGIELVDKQNFLKYLVRNVRSREPHLYIFLCDQHTAGGIPVDFLGRPACTVGMPGVLVERYDAPTLVGACTRAGPGHYRIDIDALDRSKYAGLPKEQVAPAVTADISRVLGEFVERAPAQWTWGHRRWRDCCRASVDRASEPTQHDTPQTASEP